MTISSDDIEEQAQNPKQIQGDEGMVTERSVDELIKADRYSKHSSASSPPFGLRIGKAKPFGTVQ